MTLRDEREFYSLMFSDNVCDDFNETFTLEEIEEAIGTCEYMLAMALERPDQDKSEIKMWRKMLQENKIARRELLQSI